MHHLCSPGCASAFWIGLAFSLAVYFSLASLTRHPFSQRPLLLLILLFTCLLYLICVETPSLWGKGQSEPHFAIQEAIQPPLSLSGYLYKGQTWLVDTEGKQSCRETPWPWLGWARWLPSKCLVLTEWASALRGRLSPRLGSAHSHRAELKFFIAHCKG